jgi:predicted CXXCH cytochrome family protein
MKNINLTFILLLLCAGYLVPGNAVAKVKGNCSSCHTMHNSLDGNSLIGNDTPQQALLNNDCLGCHTATANAINDGSNTTPYVHSTSGLSEDGDDDEYGASGIEGSTLAGGTFKYVDTYPTYGHNIVGLSRDALDIPPGYSNAFAAADTTTPGEDWENNQITCAGTYGCHGSHDTTSNTEAIHGGHHSDIAIGSDNSPAAGYRMLVGIEGIEDSDWEYQPTFEFHNQYKGLDGGNNDSTISYLCAECHGTFHDGSTDSPWLRHPTDFSMSNASGSEYSSYGGTGNPYMPATPLASNSVVNVVSNIILGTSDIVTCISCHRAHGSPYYKSMRWDYAGSSNGGLCSNCHTSKN